MSAPLNKVGTNIGLNINDQQFELTDNTLNIKAGVLSPAQHKHSSLFSPDGSIEPLTIDSAGNVVIAGNIYQNGSTYVVNAEQINTSKNTVVLRDGAVSGLGSGEYVGLVAKLYDGVNDGQLVFDNQGWARVGDVGNLQKLATIEETPVNNCLIKYDTTANKLVSIGTLQLDAENRLKIGSWGGSSGIYFNHLSGTNPTNMYIVGGNDENNTSGLNIVNSLFQNVVKFKNDCSTIFSSSVQATTGKFTNLVNGYLPYQNGGELANCPIYTDGVNIAVNHTNPTEKLHINAGNILLDGVGSKNITLTRSGGASVQFGASTLVTGGFFKTLTASPVKIGTNNIDRLVISASGGMSFGSSTYTTIDSGLNNVIIEGKIGIGTTTPYTKLDVAGKLQVSSANLGFAGLGDINIYNPDTARLELYNSNASVSLQAIKNGTDVNMTVSLTGVERLRILNNGNIGIGYSTGNEITDNKLAVNGSTLINGEISSYGRLYSTVSNATEGIRLSGASGLMRIYPYYDSTYGTIIESSDIGITARIPISYAASKHQFYQGNVLINTTSDNGIDKLQVNGSIQATTAKLTNLTDGRIPYHINDAIGLGDSDWNFNGSGHSLELKTAYANLAGFRLGEYGDNPYLRFFRPTGTGNNTYQWQISTDANDKMYFGRHLVVNRDSEAFTGFSSILTLANSGATINGDLHVTGNITAEKDVIAYVTSAVSSDVLNLLSVSQPLVKSGTNISLNVNSQYFDIVSGALTLKLSAITTTTDWSVITNKPTFAAVATSGSYNDLTNKPSFSSTIAGCTDKASYFTGTKALTAANADNASYATNASYASSVDWSGVTSKPTIYSTISSLTDKSSYFTGTKALTAANADNASYATTANNSSNLNNISGSNFYHNTSTSIATQTFQIKNSGGAVIWNVTTDGSSLFFSNGSNKCKVDSSGNLYTTGNITAYATI